MKTYKAVLFSCAALLLVMGFICSGNKSEDSKKDVQDKQETQPDKNELKMSGYRIIHKELVDTNKRMNYSIHISYPQIEGTHSGSAGAFNTYTFKVMNGYADSFRVDMKDWKQKSEYGSEFEITDTVIFVNEDVISVLFSVYSSFAGTAHPSHYSVSINYDLKLNKVLNISDLFTGNYLDIISRNSIQQIIKQKKEYSDGQPIDTTDIYTGAGPKKENFEVFNITQDSLFISFPEYQVGAYVEGDFYSAIPYSALKDVLNTASPIKDLIKK